MKTVLLALAVLLLFLFLATCTSHDASLAYYQWRGWHDGLTEFGAVQYAVDCGSYEAIGRSGPKVADWAKYRPEMVDMSRDTVLARSLAHEIWIAQLEKQSGQRCTIPLGGH